MATSRNAARILVLAAVLTAPGAALAQEEDQGVRRRQPVREPIIDLEEQARQRRPGQVMPGDGVPDYEPPAETAEPATPAPAQPAPAATEPTEPGAAAPITVMPSDWVTVPAAVKVQSMTAIGRMAQWRSVGPEEEVGVWSSPMTGAAFETGAEIRTGLGAEVTVEVGGWLITVDRLTKAAILSAENIEDGSRRVEVHLDRGQVRAVAQPGTPTPLVVITVEGTTPIEGGVGQVTHDAFRGTRVQ